MPSEQDIAADEAARRALAEVEARRGQASDIATLQSFPRWLILGLSVTVLALAAFIDVRVLKPEWDSWVLRYVVPLVFAAVMVVLGLRASRAAGIRLGGTARRAASGACWVVVTLFLGVYLVVGAALRFAAVPWDQTLAVAAALVVTLGVALPWLRHRRRSADVDGGDLS